MAVGVAISHDKIRYWLCAAVSFVVVLLAIGYSLPLNQSLIASR